MRLLEKIVLHPKLENEARAPVRAWCEQNLISGSWSINSNYDDHGCFDVTVTGAENDPAVTVFMLIHPDTVIVDSLYTDVYEIAPEAVTLFEGF